MSDARIGAEGRQVQDLAAARGGQPDEALERRQGADIDQHAQVALDVGGKAVAERLRRVEPAIAGLRPRICMPFSMAYG